MNQNDSKIITLIGSLLIFSTSSHAEIYKWVDDQGKVHFGDMKPVVIEAEELNLRINTYTSVTYDVSSLDYGKKVIMYSTDWCGYCKLAKKYFKKNNIAYTEYDIEKDVKAKKRYRKMGAQGVPVILVGKKRMNGFSEKGFERIYK